MSPEELRVTKAIAGVPSLPEQDVVFTKLHNALNGSELRQAIITKVTEALARDQRFSTNLTFPNVAWAWKLDLLVHPSENPNIHVDGMDGYAQEDDEGFLVEREGEGWPRAIYVNVNAGSMPQHPDDVRAETGQSVPRAVRGQDGFPITEHQGSADVDIPGEYDEVRQVQSKEAEKAVENLRNSEGGNIRNQRMLREGQAARPHKVVESSPLAGQTRDRQFDRPDREPDNQHSDPRMVREGTKIKAVRSEPAPDPRFHHNKGVLGPDGAVAKAFKLDPREAGADSEEGNQVPRARVVSIKKADGSLTSPEVAEKAASQIGKGVDVVGMGQGDAPDLVDDVLSEE
jgi:hypothetical protein